MVLGYGLKGARLGTAPTHQQLDNGYDIGIYSP